MHIQPDALPLRADHFAPILIVPTMDGRRLAQITPTAPCEWCCHWSYPLTVVELKAGQTHAPMTFEQWLVYHWHVVNHQQGALVS